MKTPLINARLSRAQLLSLANETYGAGGTGEGSVLSLRGAREIVNGQMYLANEERFVEGNFSEPLTTYAVGWLDNNPIADTLEHIAPVVPVGRRFEFAKATNSEEFLSEFDDVRSIGSSFGYIEYTASKVNSKTLNKGLTIRVDMDQVREMPNWRQVYTQRIMRRLLRNELRRAVTLLIAAGTVTPYTWDTSAGKDPDQDMEARFIAFQDAAGVPANRLLFGRVAWSKRRQAHRAQNTAGGFASAGMSIDEVAAYLGCDAGKVSNERYQTNATTKARVVPDVAVLYLAEANQSPEDPSSIKRFQSMTDGGTPMRVYEQVINQKLTDLTVEHYSNIVVTSTLGIQVAQIS